MKTLNNRIWKIQFFKMSLMQKFNIISAKLKLFELLDIIFSFKF